MFKYLKVGRGGLFEPGDELCAGNPLLTYQEVQQEERADSPSAG